MPLKPFKPFKPLRRGRGTGAGMVGSMLHGLGMVMAWVRHGRFNGWFLVATPWHGLYHGWFLVLRLGHGRVMVERRPSNGFSSQNKLHIS